MVRKRYRKKQSENQIVTAVQLNLETQGLSYIKWGGEQRCKAGDWLVDNKGECYTVEEESFYKTYRKVVPGQYIKFSHIWAYQSEADGKVKTREGYTQYKAGDYIVSNNEHDNTDEYSIAKARFEKTYELDEN